MRISKSLLAAVSMVAALAVAPAMAANDPNFGQMMSSIQAAKTSPDPDSGSDNCEERQCRKGR